MKMIVSGLATEYSDEGSGPTLLMLHGWKDTLHSFDALARELSGSFRIVRLDMPGFGASEMPEPTWKLDDYVDFVEAFMVKMHLDVAALVGHSFGGRVIIKGLSRGVFHPEKTVLIAAAGVSEKKKGRTIGLRLIAKAGKFATAPLPRGVRAKLRRRLYQGIGSDYMATGALKDIFISVVAEDLSDAAASVKTPTLLIWGEKDTQTPLSEGAKLARLVRGAKLETMPSAGHFIHQEYPEKVATLIRHFI